MKNLLLTFAFTLSFLGFAQESVIFNYLNFKTDYERESWKNPSRDYLDLSMSIDSSFTKEEGLAFKNRLKDFYQQNNFSSKSGKKRIKNVKALYLAIHDAFLRRYREQVDFSDLVRKGEYNCFTASVLYSEMLEHYGIPYIILSEYDHVFLVAYPDEEYIVLQTTSPNFDDYQVEEKVRKANVDRMLNGKMLTQMEVDTLGMNRAYEIYINEQTRVNLMELIGYDYSNQMVYLFQEKINFEQASEMGMRAMYLIPNNKELSARFFEMGRMGVAVTGFRSRAALYLCLSNIHSQAKSQISLMAWPSFVAYSDLLCHVAQKYPAFSELMLKKGVNAFNAATMFSGSDDFMNEADYSTSYEEMEEMEDWIYETFMEYDFEDLEVAVDDLVKDEEWRKLILIQTYTLAINFKWEVMDELPKETIEKLRSLDPENKLIQRLEIELFKDEFRARLLNEKEDIQITFSEMLKSADSAGIDQEFLFELGYDLFTDYEEKCKNNFYNRRITSANQEFDVCLFLFKKLKKMEGVDKGRIESLEYKMGSLYLKKSENVSPTQEKKLIDEGHYLIPNHVMLKARYDHYRR
ncbi:MAG: hypothetical protein N4A41_07580 [Crocinitomicaceae bacterium]|jgi:hypothetical protein|nr:hypothetical protein [Crocinitomicaceae bacterium]